MQDRIVAIGVWETLGDIFQDELEIIRCVDVLDRNKIDALPVREVNGRWNELTTCWTCGNSFAISKPLAHCQDGHPNNDLRTRFQNLLSVFV
jgi:hypothetical protein